MTCQLFCYFLWMRFFYKKLVGKGKASYEDVGYTSTCGKALERFNQLGFADVETALQRSSMDDIHIVLIQGDDLKEFVDSDFDVLDWLEKLVTKLH